MTIDPTAFRAARQKSGLSQGQLARAAETSQQLIGAIETGRINSTKKLLRLAAALSVDPGQIDSEYRNTFTSEGTIRDQDSFELPVFISGPLNDFDQERYFRTAAPIDKMNRRLSALAGMVIWSDDMEPRYRPGEVALLDSERPPRRGGDALFERNVASPNIGDSRLVFAPGGQAIEALIRTIVDYDAKSWTVERLNPNSRQRLLRSEWTGVTAIAGTIAR